MVLLKVFSFNLKDFNFLTLIKISIKRKTNY